MSLQYRSTEDPVRLLRWRGRQSWRRAARRIVAEHVDEVLARLAEFREQPVYGLTTTAAGTVRAMVPGWAISVAGVATTARSALSDAAQYQCQFGDAGRYGRFWWFAVVYQVAGDLGRTTILGSQLVLAAIEDGRAWPGAPRRSPLVLPS